MTVLQALTGQKVEKTPIWFLRQAGRYLPEYQEIRKSFDFVELCLNPNFASEVTLQPLRRFDLDAAIIFSDILLICQSLGQNLTFAKDHGPCLAPAMSAPSLMKELKKHPNIAKDLAPVGETVALVKKQLKPHQTLIGFSGAPYTVASYMIEGASSKSFSGVKSWMYSHPREFVDLLKYLAEHTLEYLKLQVEAGAQALMIFDSWACEIPTALYRELIFPVTNQLLAETKKLAPIIYFPGAGSEQLGSLTGTHANGIAVHWKTPLETAYRTLGKAPYALQGNLDPFLLTLNDETIVKAHVRKLLDEARRLPVPHIFNVGHGLTPQTNPKAIEWAIEEVRSGS